ncbi:hypothetical protein C8N43_0754 [Litoreibacter ponti]|uniref:Uncharacterized protein n=1 Tax=Litoreibacter ponti TaxID=1510457 RepID=A0A2T6BJ64_9RHOB|nr:hypothetical protein [Litoreibacter ponti]PTX56103.1 hypothetical protein C8N43_0754 [Litoreibacter ponti]
MKVKRLKVVLPAPMAATSTHDARAIAEAVGKAIGQGATPDGPIKTDSHGQRGTVLAGQVAAGLKGGKHGR